MTGHLYVIVIGPATVDVKTQPVVVLKMGVIVPLGMSTLILGQQLGARVLVMQEDITQVNCYNHKESIAGNASQKLTLQPKESFVLTLQLVSLGQTTFMLAIMSFVISNTGIFDEGTGNTITGESVRNDDCVREPI